MKFAELIEKINEMRQRLGWDISDTNETLLSYLLEEVAELKIEMMKQPIDIAALKSELADVLMVLLSIIDDNDLDASEIVLEKMKEVIQKYESYQ